MHELSLAREVEGQVAAAARRDGFHRVGQLRLEVGALAGVEVDALRSLRVIDLLVHDDRNAVCSGSHRNR